MRRTWDARYMASRQVVPPGGGARCSSALLSLPPIDPWAHLFFRCGKIVCRRGQSELLNNYGKLLRLAKLKGSEKGTKGKEHPSSEPPIQRKLIDRITV